MRATPTRQFHPRNRHQGSYDFRKLAKTHPPLAKHLVEKPEGGPILDFSDPEAVSTLNTAILHHDYRIERWSLPEGYLCPPVPGRADYLHYLDDLLKNAETGRQNPYRILDIGTGAGAIYAVLGASIYGWNMVASDVDRDSLANCKRILEANPTMKPKMELRHQTDPSKILDGVIGEHEIFDATMCNPPFFDSEEAADHANLKKQKKHRSRGIPFNLEKRAFQGQPNERYCKGGERGFIERLVAESSNYSRQFRWFTVLLSRRSTLDYILPKLEAVEAKQHRIIPMQHGNKECRVLAWTYDT